MQDIKTSKKTSKKQEDALNSNVENEMVILIDIAKFRYLGKEPYYHKDAKGRAYTFFENDILFIAEGEVARYFDYKKTLFERLNDE